MFDQTLRRDRTRLACRPIEREVRKTLDDDTEQFCRSHAWTFARKSETRFRTVVSTDLPPIGPSSGGSNGAEIDPVRGEQGGKRKRERERHGRWASGSGLTRRSNQGWAHDQILSLIWRRFTQKSPFSLLFPPAFLDVSFSLPPPNYPRQLLVDFTAPFHPSPPRTLPRCSRDRSVKPHTLGIEYIKVPSILSLQLYYASFRSSVLFLSLPFYLSGTLLPSIAGR